MLNPIEGAYYWPETREYVAHRSFSVGAPTEAQTRLSLEVSGTGEYVTRRALSVGNPVDGMSRRAMTVGGSRIEGLTLVALDVQGLVSEYLSRTLRSLTVAPPPSQYVTYLGLDVINTQAVNGVTRLGLTVNGESFSRHTRLGLTVRQQTEYVTRRGHTVSAYVETLARQSLDVIKAGVEGITPLALDVADMDGLLVLADVLGGDFTMDGGQDGGNFYPYTDITAAALVGGVELPVKRFDYSAAPDRLGAVFNIEVARPDFPVALNDDFTFALVVTDRSGEPHPYTLVNGGKIQGRDITIQWSGNGPGDTLNVSGFDAEADKFGLAPRASVTIFDPDKVEWSGLVTNPRDAISDEAGRLIMPQLEPVVGLTMLTALRRAYTNGGSSRFATPLNRQQQVALERVSAYMTTGKPYTEGLGFEQVVTNIPDYPVSRADFTNEGGWHDGCQPLVGMYGPIYVVEFNTLLVLDTFRPLPFGYVARAVPVSQYMALNASRAIAQPFNAVLLTYQVRGDEDTYVTYRYEVDKQENDPALFGQLGYQRVETVDKWREVRAKLDDSLLSATVEEHRASTYAVVPDPDTGLAGLELLIQRETQFDFYQDDFKVGHKKTVESVLYTGPQPSLELQPVLEETCKIVWIDDPQNPGQKVQSFNWTRYQGLVYVSTETETRLNPVTGETGDYPKVFPALVADSSGVMADDGTLEWRPIRLVSEHLRTLKGNQLDVMITDADLLKGQTKFSKSEPRVSSGLRSVNKYEVRAKTMMIRGLDSEAEIGPRIPPPVNAGELPRDRAIELARRVLRDGFDPPESYRVDLPGVDFAIRRGSVLKGQYRDGNYTPPFIVRGFTITGNGLGVPGQHRISMSLEAIELR